MRGLHRAAPSRAGNAAGGRRTYCDVGPMTGADVIATETKSYRTYSPVH